MGSYRQIIVDGSPTGLQGLNEVFARFYAGEYRPDEDRVGRALLEAVGKDNYIPHSARNAYADALVREYRLYVARRERGETTESPDYGTWLGHPRETIPWFPTVNQDLCDGCGRCLDLCSKGCLAPTADGKVRVADPFLCIVGCSSCTDVCTPEAITFPLRSMLDNYRRK
jgi:NAD-dependent dihydropyrimidine dehydrogenase PreA subunit